MLSSLQGFASPPVILNMDDLHLDRTAAEAAAGTPPPARAAKPAARPAARPGAKTGAKAGGSAKAGLAKKYGPGFIWGQLNGWYKQTVYDPTASLSAERRGTVSLPDIDSCYGTGVKTRYSAKARSLRLSRVSLPAIAEACSPVCRPCCGQCMGQDGALRTAELFQSLLATC